MRTVLRGKTNLDLIKKTQKRVREEPCHILRTPSFRKAALVTVYVVAVECSEKSSGE